MKFRLSFSLALSLITSSHSITHSFAQFVPLAPPSLNILLSTFDICIRTSSTHSINASFISRRFFSLLSLADFFSFVLNFIRETEQHPCARKTKLSRNYRRHTQWSLSKTYAVWKRAHYFARITTQYMQQLTCVNYTNLVTLQCFKKCSFISIFYRSDLRVLLWPFYAIFSRSSTECFSIILFFYK